MDFSALLNTKEDTDKTRKSLYFVRSVLKETAHVACENALHSAQNVLDVAMASGPMVDIFVDQHLFVENMRRSQEAVVAAGMVNTGILHLEETTNDEIDAANECYKEDTMNMDVINALIEAAVNRMNMARQSFPSEMLAGARCNGRIYKVQESPQPIKED